MSWGGAPPCQEGALEAPHPLLCAHRARTCEGKGQGARQYQHHGSALGKRRNGRGGYTVAHLHALVVPRDVLAHERPGIASASRALAHAGPVAAAVSHRLPRRLVLAVGLRRGGELAVEAQRRRSRLCTCSVGEAEQFLLPRLTCGVAGRQGGEGGGGGGGRAPGEALPALAGLPPLAGTPGRRQRRQRKQELSVLGSVALALSAGAPWPPTGWPASPDTQPQHHATARGPAREQPYACCSCRG